METFKLIRECALMEWSSCLHRSRQEGDLSDDYSESNLCAWQQVCLADKKHCSFLCSYGDWLDNISDLLRDDRFDNLSKDNSEVLFRYFTKILLLISEVIEDIVQLNKEIKNLQNKKVSGEDLEFFRFEKGELKLVSDYINAICKHKTIGNNLHVHNHHLKIEFCDFGDNEHENQIRLNLPNWTKFDANTSLLIPTLSYFINIVIKLDSTLDYLLSNKPGYKERLFELYADEWHSN